ncbi:MAG TPA: hypothetical protein VK735_38240 [Pseudonocardia sp.]|jgi:hypothetical protein|uniref:hypothetical protein n=1 Tax=Pseudonocardia sp. TaxID=60912 RepID=UPI002BD620A7|nr:hypothetical protein [Pseudonocardia sp.]HTF53322.1 hypothetical protein [Pseudonocardia sp.]
MASPFKMFGEFLKSPQGRRITEQAKGYARDPHNRAKAKEMIAKLRGKGGGSGRH